MDPLLRVMGKFLLQTVTVRQGWGNISCSITLFSYCCRGREKGLTIQVYQLYTHIKTRTRLQLQQRLTESHQALLSAAVDIIESPHAHDVLGRASNQEKNVCLFTYLYLGAERFDCLRTATQLVPPSFEERRASYTARTVNSVCPRIVNDELITAVLPQCNGPFFDRHACFDAYLPELRTISESSGKAHTAYIAPPVTYCLNTSFLDVESYVHSSSTTQR